MQDEDNRGQRTPVHAHELLYSRYLDHLLDILPSIWGVMTSILERCTGLDVVSIRQLVTM